MPESPLEFQALGKGLAAWKFSQGAFQAAWALVPSLLRREMGVGEGPPTPPGSFSWRTGQEVGWGLRKDAG